MIDSGHAIHAPPFGRSFEGRCLGMSNRAKSRRKWIKAMENPSMRDKLREDVSRLWRSRRDALLRERRKSTNDAHNDVVISCHLRDVLREGISHSINSVSAECQKQTLDSRIERSSEQAQSSVASNSQNGMQDEDFEALIKELEDSLYAEFLRDYPEIQMEEKEDALDWLEFPVPNEDITVLCPSCNQAYLQQREGRIFCPKESFTLNSKPNGMELEQLRSRLEEIFSVHRLTCTGFLQFFVDTKMGVSTLCASCNQCQLLKEIV